MALMCRVLLGALLLLFASDIAMARLTVLNSGRGMKPVTTGTCPGKQVRCDVYGTCKNLQTDPFSCGRCGNRCPPGYGCNAGACKKCPAGQLNNTNACVPSTDVTAVWGPFTAWGPGNPPTCNNFNDLTCQPAELPCRFNYNGSQAAGSGSRGLCTATLAGQSVSARDADGGVEYLAPDTRYQWRRYFDVFQNKVAYGVVDGALSYVCRIIFQVDGVAEGFYQIGYYAALGRTDGDFCRVWVDGATRPTEFLAPLDLSHVLVFNASERPPLLPKPRPQPGTYTPVWSTTYTNWLNHAEAPCRGVYADTAANTIVPVVGSGDGYCYAAYNGMEVEVSNFEYMQPSARQYWFPSSDGAPKNKVVALQTATEVRYVCRGYIQLPFPGIVPLTGTIVNDTCVLSLFKVYTFPVGGFDWLAWA